ncbi:MAG: TlpA family protein disulfide reductase, partial [Aureliella sp.]
ATTASQQTSSAQAKPADATPATPAPTPAAAAPFPDLAIPENADRAALEKIIAAAKQAQPTNPDQFRQVQTALRDASSALIKRIEDKNDPVRMQAELDALSSSAALMVSDPNQSREQLLKQMQAHLDGRDELTLADVQTGIVVAFYLEMQPQKTPARDAYAMLAKRLEGDSREEMQALRVTLQASVRRLEMLGKKLPLDATSTDGKAIKTDDFAGKFVIVDFFAVWCQPCVAELPQLQKYFEKYRDQGLEVITISIDADRKGLDAFLASHKLPWPVVSDNAGSLDDSLQMKFGVLSLPTVWLLNKEGVVVSLEARGPELDRLMQRIFDAPTPAEEPAKQPAQQPASADNGKNPPTPVAK